VHCQLHPPSEASPPGRLETIDGDIAWVMAVGVIKGEIDGESVEIPFTATDVQRRGADVRWRYVLDHG